LTIARTAQKGKALPKNRLPLKKKKKRKIKTAQSGRQRGEDTNLLSLIKRAARAGSTGKFAKVKNPM